MTLIVGTTHWNGICLNSDTRVTNKSTGTYHDNAQKLAHIHGGFGMVASGDRQSAILVRETIRKRLDDFENTGIKFDHSIDLTGVTEMLLTSALKETRGHSIHKTRPIYDTASKGLIGTCIPDQRLRLNQEECNNVMSIIVNGCQGLELDQGFYKKYILKVAACMSGELPFVEFDEYPQSNLYKYDLKLFDDELADRYDLQRVPFGEIVAMGSGSEFDYSSERDRVLFFTLFNGKFGDVGLGSLHLSMIHEMAEGLAPKHKIFDIKTFGGAIVPGLISTLPNGAGVTHIIECDLGSKIEGRVVSKTYHRGNELWVQTRSGEDLELERFPDSVDVIRGMYW